MRRAERAGLIFGVRNVIVIIAATSRRWVARSILLLPKQIDQSPRCRGEHRERQLQRIEAPRRDCFTGRRLADFGVRAGTGPASGPAAPRARRFTEPRGAPAARKRRTIHRT